MTQVVNEVAMARDRGYTPRWPYLLARLSAAGLGSTPESRTTRFRIVSLVSVTPAVVSGHLIYIRNADINEQ